jgi:2-iminobutanoate/2-iminopropanoate deaminase
VRQPKQIIAPAGLGEPVGPFVRGVRVGNLVAISGTSSLSHRSGPMRARELASGIEAQARETFSNLGGALADAGLTWDEVIKMTVIIKRAEDYEAMNRVRAELFSETPFASTTFVADLMRDDMLIEADVWAVAPEDDE